MKLKRYQERVLAEVERFLDRVAAERATGNTRHAALDAWQGLNLGVYHSRRNGLGEDLPTFCIKVPTGGGKTLLKDRGGTGLVLWVVPSSQIYRDTLRRLRDPNDSYRLMLEHALSHRLEVWEKQDILRLTPNQLANNLNVFGDDRFSPLATIRIPH